MVKIIYIGNYRDVDQQGQSFNTEAHIARELERLGHEVLRLQEPFRNSPRARQFLQRVEREADHAGADLLLYTRTWGLPGPEAIALWRRLERNGTVTASYHLDLYRGLEREDSINGDPFWATQFVFTPDGNPDTDEWFAARGVNHIWSPPAVVSDECAVVMPGQPRPQFLRAPIAFVGSAGYHPEWPWRGQLLQWLSATYGARFRRYSGDVPPGPVRGRALNNLYASCSVVIGDSCFAAPEQRYWSDRPFETYGRGGLMIFPFIHELVNMIGSYPAYDVGDFAGLRREIDAALEMTRGERHAIVDPLAERIHAEHTYKHRLAAALERMELA